MQTRQLLTGMLLALAVFFAYQWALSLFLPPRPAPTTQPTPAVPPTTQVVAETRPAESIPATTTIPRRELAFSEGESQAPLTIGGGAADALRLTLSPRGAGVEAIRITQQHKNRYVYRTAAGQNEPYEILDLDTLRSVAGGREVPLSFATRQIRIAEYGDRAWPLEELVWRVAEATPQRVVFTTTLLTVDRDEPVLRLTKAFELQPGQPLVNLALTLENAGDQPLGLILEQDGPTSIRREAEQYDMRRVMVARREAQTLKIGRTAQRAELEKKALAGETVELFKAREGAFAWAALVNRFFGVFVRPLPTGQTPTGVDLITATVAIPESSAKLGDMVTRLVSPKLTLPPGGEARQLYEIYVGPKDNEVLAAINPEFVDRTKIGYDLARSADQSCYCTFEPLPQVMTTLLHWIQVAVRNYGVAIMVLVLIVRTILHPLSVYQQKQMFRMQDSMARLQPKLEALKEQYKNDKVRLNQETMKLYAEQGVNPMASFIGMVPMFLQMPILVALWTSLNTDVQLRHAPFDGWWIKDLAAPDALLMFDPPLTIPILGQLPWLGAMFHEIPALNLLPLVMGVSMWLQQKYMPKPGMHAKLEAARKHPPRERKPGQLTPEEQLRQQRIMAYVMTVMFPLMFYYMPAGLNLYWMATNVFGIFESLIIRKQLQQEKERREKEGPPPPGARKTGLVGRVLKKMAAQAEQIQRRADALSDVSRTRPRKDRDADQRKR